MRPILMRYPKATDERQRALEEVAEAAKARQAIRGPLPQTLKERAAAEMRLEEALARLPAAEEGT